jgi:(4S)-4-hydroxy-5-phosphonooxypentane-2,3-dione isomerase
MMSATYVVAVDFTLKPEHAADFQREILANARTSVKDEPGCHQFDVCQDPAKPEQFFLYEIYEGEAGFNAHLATAHYKVFNELTTPWVTGKVVRKMQRIP